MDRTLVSDLTRMILLIYQCPVPKYLKTVWKMCTDPLYGTRLKYRA